MKEKLLIDSEVILQQLKEQQAVNKQLAKQNQVLVEQMNKIQQRIDELLLQSIDRNDLNKNLMVQLEQMQQYILKLQNMLFGTKSEKSKKKDLKANKNNKKNSSSGSTSKQSKSNSKNNGRSSLSKDLPRKQTEHDIPEDERNCKCCNTELHFMGKIVTE